MNKGFEHRISEKGIGILDIKSSNGFSKALAHAHNGKNTKSVPKKFILSIIYFLSLSLSLILLFR